LKMVGFKNNVHHWGVLDMRRALNKLSTQKESLKP
jgi:hypothetical protein